MEFKIKAKLEISDHDGWCSDNECYYSCFINKYIIKVPNDIKYYNNFDFTTLLPVPNINCGSDYCELNLNHRQQFWDCKNNNLERHEYKYTILYISYNIEL